MNRIKLSFMVLALFSSGLWLLADTLLPQPLTYFSFRSVFVQFSGWLAMVAMSLAMLLALRPKWLERPLDGLDKMYRLHKWLGISALVLGLLHWWWAKGTKWMVGWGWLVKPPRSGAAPEYTGLEAWLRTQRGLAEELGEWAFYIALVLLVLALVKAFPYRLFRKTHKLLALVYLVLVYHTLVLFKFAYWSQPLGWVMAALLLVGAVAAVLVLTGRIGRRRKVAGTICSVQTYPGVQVVEGSIALQPGWPGHKPGQFAFVTSSRSEGAHPYTIASAWNPQQQQLHFVIKALGDWTGQLQDYLHEGMPVQVEGPYGCFDFTDQQPRQIWIGAGIGITPFIAKMQHRASQPSSQTIDLFHVTAERDDGALDKLRADAAAAGVNLHIRLSLEEGRLTAEQIRAAVPEWQQASIWFCGPAEFGQALQQDFRRHGLARGRFHQELFNMR